MSSLAGRGHQALDYGDARADQVLLEQPQARQVEEHQRFVMLERSVQQPGAKRR